MDWKDVIQKDQRKNQILFSRESACLQPLLVKLRTQKHRTIALWALECAEKPAADLFVRYPEDLRPQTAIHLSKEWAAGRIKMPAAKQAILQVHAMAKDISSVADRARCHAVGQACGAVHVETHGIGLAFYELTALVRENGIGTDKVPQRIEEYLQCLERYEKEIDSYPHEWASFLLNDRPNREQLLWEKSFYRKSDI